MQVNENVSLLPYTTFYIGGPSRYLIFAQDNEEIAEAAQFAHEKGLSLFVMGGGSNVVVADSGFAGVTVRIETVGIDMVGETDDGVVLKIASGEVWDDVVRFAVEENWWGIENLSHIPGFSGAFTVQNVGAYGQEASQVVQSVEVLDREDFSTKVLTHEQLKFGYRRSVLNQEMKGRYIVLSTTIKLSKHPHPKLSYGDLAERFSGTVPEIAEVRRAIIETRDQKFPFPSEPTKGNSGSFFRGRILTASEFTDLERQIQSLFGDSASKRLAGMSSRLKVDQGYKTPTAFLIELSVGKNLESGGASLNPNQPAIVLNHTGRATAADVLALFRKVQAEVKAKTGVLLEAEPDFVGFAADEMTGLKFR